jgi:hypothetical protein
MPTLLCKHSGPESSEIHRLNLEHWENMGGPDLIRLSRGSRLFRLSSPSGLSSLSRRSRLSSSSRPFRLFGLFGSSLNL